ncbi:methyl-accepting chemotaxis protein [Brevundimonas diminuta]|uniref:Methyl-accepting chemotaxis protein n=2 Tax=Brevundimonas diminuta TaxID=293 RepID=A0A410NWM9_BREDI|nr:PAS domain-containing methyl-accepting chemotaxis protein [Brevundimonas diminuta]QAT14276.1 PAS domain S-box protein [Brevundimonas diminuta]QQB88352.1 methyl-accepting chemotaxis protein [Brevundimonas diminuta]
MFSGSRRVKQAADQLRLEELDRRMAAIGRSQAVIEFDLDGTIRDANDNLLQTMGYGLDEIRGQHHRMFMDPAEAATPDYAAFWRELNEGRFVARKFRRMAKGGREVWLETSYNPVLDDAGRPLKVVKLAVDITETEQASRRAERDRLAVEAAQAELVGALAEQLSRLSDGDLRAAIEQEMGGAHEAVKVDFNGAVASLRAALEQVLAAVTTLRGGSDEISRASDDLSRRTEQQAASLEETAAALDQITATVQRSAEGARQAASVASQAHAEADRSGEVVRRAVAAMDGISRRSAEISDIVGVIDAIAFQTNLLALNAGVEAARAGDSGRGFAVVASEVRALAQRSAEAAKEIKTLIAASGAEVAQGVELVAETGRALETIAEQVDEMDALVAAIAASAQEQASGLGQVNQAVNQMDQVTQQNAAMVEQTTAAAANLKTQAEHLAELVGRFRTGGSDGVVHDLARRGGPPPALEAQRARLRAVVNGPAVEEWTEF